MIGVGNEFRRDDGAGPAVLASLRDRVPPGVDLVLTDGEPTRLIEAWTGAAVAVVIDAVPRWIRTPLGPDASLRDGTRPWADGTGRELARVRPGRRG